MLYIVFWTIINLMMSNPMKRIFLLFIASLAMISINAQSSNLSNLLEEGYSAAELEKIFDGVSYKKHQKWMKSEGYTDDASKSTDQYFY